jgi:putative membrane protein
VHLKVAVKTLILGVDRDDDLGRKAGIQTPLVGRRRTLEAATALGLADPEDSDTNALFAAVHLYDEESKRLAGSPDTVEVACIGGHPSLGMKADRKLAAELDEVINLVRPDEAILVTDGAEDEQIIPLLQARVKIGHIHRSVVKQAPRLEGFYYVLTRLLDDEKQAKRFVLPFGAILLVWGLAYLAGLQAYTWGATLTIAGFTLIIQAMKWEEKVGLFFADLGRGLRSGKVTLLSLLLSIALLLWGSVQAWSLTPGAKEATNGFRALVFSLEFLPYLVSSLLILIAGRLFDDWARRGRTHLGQWSSAFAILASYLILGVALAASADRLQGAPLIELITFDRAVKLAAGASVAVAGTLVARYVRSFTQENGRARQVR